MRNPYLRITLAFLVVGIVLYLLGVSSTKLHISVAAEPVWCLGGERASLTQCTAGIPITNSLILTVIVDLFLLWLALSATRNLQLIPQGMQNLMEALIEALYNFAQGVDRKNVAKFFPFFASVFLFALFSNLFGLVPGVGSIGVCAAAGHGEEHATLVNNQAPKMLLKAEEEEETKPSGLGLVDPTAFPLSCEKGTTLVPFLRAPSADLNVTLAWGLVSVFLIQVFGFQALGSGYLHKFFNMELYGLLGILELISEFVRIIAFAFRLFGNIFAGEVILVVMAFLFPYVLPAPFYAFELFVAFIQAVIFGVLSLVFMSLATIPHGGEDHGHGAGAH